VSFRKVAVLFFVTACSNAIQTMPNNGQLTGGATPQLAVDQFLVAVRNRDLQAMSTVFGTNKGPARETMDRTELEKREIILACYFNNDSYRILGEQSGQADHREVRAEIRRASQARQTTFYAVKGPGGRWYIDNMDIASVRDFCGNSGSPSNH
jgi:hypothetical protein